MAGEEGTGILPLIWRSHYRLNLYRREEQSRAVSQSVCRLPTGAVTKSIGRLARASMKAAE